MKGEKFMFSIADGSLKLDGEDQDLRTSTLIWDSPDRGEEQDNLRGESEGSSSIHVKTHRGMMVKPKLIFGPFQAISFIVITLYKESNCTCRLKNHFLFHSNILT